MKKIFAFAAALALLLGILTACGSGNSDELSGKHHVEIVIRDYGTIAVELDADAAPITVANFLKLAKSGFYDGLTFHRIINGFMMQGGDPEGTGMGGSSEKIKGEFSANGVKNDLSHTRGAISMARSQAMDSASSQFFIAIRIPLSSTGSMPASAMSRTEWTLWTRSARPFPWWTTTGRCRTGINRSWRPSA